MKFRYDKRDLIIEKQKVRPCNKVNVCAIQNINPFYSSISANDDKGEGFQPILKSLYPLFFLQCRISFDKTYIIYIYIISIYLHINIRIIKWKRIIDKSNENSLNLTNVSCQKFTIFIVKVWGTYRLWNLNSSIPR